jgi:hypothetical protein
MKLKYIFLVAILGCLCKPAFSQSCPNETDISNTNVCGIYGDGSGNSNWNWEMIDPLNPSYCGNWAARTSSSGFLSRMGSPFVNAGTGKLKIIADDLDYTKAKGWELLLRKFGCQSDVSSPYFALYNRYTGMIRVYVFKGQSTVDYSQLLMTVRSVYDLRPATLSDAHDIMFAPDKYLSQQAGIASNEVIVSLNESVGQNQWAVAEFYTMLDFNIQHPTYHHGSLEITIYGVTNNLLTADIEGSSNPGPIIKDGAFKATNVNTGTSSFNYTANGLKLINFSKSIDDFISNMNKIAKKVEENLAGKGDGISKKIWLIAKDVKQSTESKASFHNFFSNISGFLGTAGQIMKFAGAVVGFFKESSGASAAPSFTSYDLKVNGTISAQVVVQKFVIKIPGTSDVASNSNNATYYNGALGMMTLKYTPVVKTVTYLRRTLLPNSLNPKSGVQKTSQYTAYALKNPLEVMLNSLSGLTVLSLEGALMAKVVDPSGPVDPTNVTMNPLENYPVRGYYTYFNHMRADIEANRLEVAHYDADGGGYHIIQTPFYSFECISKASMNLNTPVTKVYIRIRAKLKRTDGLGEPLYFVKDYEVNTEVDADQFIPPDISTNVDAIPPYSNYSIPPNTAMYYDALGNYRGVDQDFKIGEYYTVVNNDSYTSKANSTIETSIDRYGNLTPYYVTINTPSPGTTWTAGSSITLNPHFEATYGSVFHANLDWGYFDLGCNYPSLLSTYNYPGPLYNSSIIAQKGLTTQIVQEEKLPMSGIFPNPAFDKVIISGINTKDVKEVHVVDMLGKSKKVIYNTLDQNSIRLNIQGYLPGSYIVRVILQNDVKQYKFVVGNYF